MDRPPDRGALVVIDDQGRIAHWDEGAVRLFGHEAAAVEGQLVEVIVPEAHLEDHRAGVARVMGGGEPHLDGAAINLPVRTASDEVLAFPARFNLLRDPHGRVIGAAAAFEERQGDEEPWSPIADVGSDDQAPPGETTPVS